MTNQGKRKKRILWLLLFLFFVLLLAIGVAWYVMRQQKSEDAAAVYERLEREVNDTGENKTKTEEETKKEASGQDESEDPLEALGVEIPEKNLDWDALRKENPDIYAWITVPDTTVDYPVLQHPTDNTYYLEHNLDGSEGYPGCIYTEDYNTKDFTDIHTVLYGHNLKDGTMFSSLHNFEDPELFNTDHYIFIYTEKKDFVYRIFAAYEFSDIHLLDNYDLSNEYVYENFLQSIFRSDGNVANIRSDIEVGTEDKILTLSTCTSDHDSSRRFLVTGVLVNP